MRPDDPSLLTPDTQLAQAAAILAAGLLRLNARAALSPETLSEMSSPGLEVSGENLLSVHSG